MAIVAVIAAVNMVRRFADGDDAVVAGSAGTEDLRMIDGNCGNENVRVVAVFANVCRLNMGRALAHSLRAIVATGAIAGYADMIEIGR